MGFEIINKLKKEKGITNAQLSRMSGVTLSTLDKITAGINTNPKLETLQAICRALGCRLDDFDDTPQNAPAYTAEALGIAKKYDVLDDWGQRVVTGVVDIEHSRCTAQSKAEISSAPAKAAELQVSDKREHKLQMVARRVEGVPEAEYERILEKFEDTIDLYLDAKKIKSDDRR